MKTILNHLIRRAVTWCNRNGRVFLITGESTNKVDVYLVRYILLKSKWCCIYIHRFMRSDSSDPHDHPWNFLTYIVEGGYEEHFYDKSKPKNNSYEFKDLWTKRINVRKPGSVAFRRATDIHRVVIPKSFTMDQVEQAPLTACVIFNRVRDWGFWPLTAGGAVFIDWRNYLNIKPNDPRTKGSE